MAPAPFRIAVFASGGGSNLGALLARFPPGGTPEVALVVSDRADAGALDRARKAGAAAEVVRPEAFDHASTYGDRLLALLAEHAIDLVVLAGFLKKIPENVVAAFPNRIVNIHPALLPRFGGPGMYGARVHAAVLAAGESESGASVHFVDPAYDHGPVIAQVKVPVLPSDTVESLAQRVLAVEHRLLPRVVELIARGKVRLGADGKVDLEEDIGAALSREAPDVLPVRRALLSVSDKRGLVVLGRALSERGVELISTGGTAAVLRGAGVAVREVAEVTGFPEMLDGRVKTLHPRIFAGILARRERPDDLEAIAREGIGPIDLVVVNLYPFAAAAAAVAHLPEDALEQIDIGGPSLLRAAAKNFAGVAVICDPDSYAELLAELDRLDGAVSLALRKRLAGSAFAHTAAYDLQVAAAFGSTSPEALPDAAILGGRKQLALRYGENPHQRAAFYTDPPRAVGLAAARVLQGKELSFNNLLDLDAAWRLVDEVGRAVAPAPAACVIVKHNTPCGVGVGAGSAEAYLRARATDPVSAFGGVCVLSSPITEELVEALAEHFLEVLAAPAVADGVRQALARKKNLRVLELPPEGPESGWDVRRVAGGLLIQEADRLPPPGPSEVTVVTGELTPDLWSALALAWATVKHVTSNAIVFGDASGTLGIGAGQMSRVDSVELAVRKAAAAGLSLAGSVVASDAFFPFRDGLDRAAEAGAVAVIQPGGSVRDAEVVAAAREHGITLVHTGKRHFRH